MIKQISVFIENSRGRLAAATRTLGVSNIDLLAISIADTADYGILRAIVSDTASAVNALKGAGYTVKTTDVIAVSVADQPGGLAPALEALSDKGFSIEYLYSFIRKPTQQAIIILKTDETEKAEALLRGLGLTPLGDAEIRTVI